MMSEFGLSTTRSKAQEKSRLRLRLGARLGARQLQDWSKTAPRFKERLEERLRT